MNEHMEPGHDAMHRAKEVGASAFAAGASGVVTHVVGQRIPATYKGKLAGQALFGAGATLVLHWLGAPKRIVEGAAGGSLAALGVRVADQMNLNGWLSRLTSSAPSTDTSAGNANANNQMGAGQGQGNAATSGYAERRAYADR